MHYVNGGVTVNNYNTLYFVNVCQITISVSNNIVVVPHTIFCVWKSNIAQSRTVCQPWPLHGGTMNLHSSCLSLSIILKKNVIHLRPRRF
jgi:hypothetical protein